MPQQITLVQQFEQQQDETLELAFSQDGKQLISSDGKALYLWRFHGDGNWSYERSLPLQGTGVLRFGPDVVFFVEGEFVKLISFDGREVTTFPRPPSRFWQITPDLRWIVSNDDKGGAIRLWGPVLHQSFSITTPFPPRDRSGKDTSWSGERVLRFLFTPNCQQVVLFADGPEGSLHICSFDPEYRRIALQKTLPGMIDGVISPDGKMLAIILSNDQIYAYKQDIYVYGLESLQLLHMFPQTTDEFYCQVAFSPDNHYLAGCRDDGWIEIFSLNTFDCLAQFAAHPGLTSRWSDPIGGLDWSRTGYIATGGASVFEKNMKKTDYTIKIWRVEE